MRTYLVAAVGVVIAVVLAGCSTSSAGSAVAGLPAADSGGSGPLPANRVDSVPKVATSASEVDSTADPATAPSAPDTATMPSLPDTSTTPSLPDTATTPSLPDTATTPVAANPATAPLAADTATAPLAADTATAPLATTTAITSAHGPSSANTDRDTALAKLVAGAPPKSLAWQLPKKIPGWTIIAHQAGALTYKVGEGCSVMVAQPMFAAGQERRSAELAQDAVTQLTRLLKSDPSTVEAVNVRGTLLAASVAGVAGSTRVEFAGLRTHFPDLPATAQTYAYASGQFGVVITAACADPDLLTYATTIAPQLQRFTLLVEY